LSARFRDKALNLSCERRYGVTFEPRNQQIRIGLTSTQLEPFFGPMDLMKA
jgi:hypothetical protein